MSYYQVNTCLAESTYPTEASIGHIIVIPKITAFTGNLKDTRPITLLQTMRKIFESLLFTRLTSTIEKHQLLQGLNFGFTKGMGGTHEPLTIITHLKDITNEENIPMYLASLDVSKEFDTVNAAALIKAMERIGLPPEFIKLHKALSKRQLYVRTAYGISDGFKPTQGLPQGGVLALLFWNIYYDPLLSYLKHHTTGFTIPKSVASVSAVAYADDLHPISSTKLGLQSQLDIIYFYMTHTKMNMGALKSHILTTLDPLHPDYPSTDYFQLGDEHITDIVPPNESIRILGIQFTMGKNQQKIKESAMINIENMMRADLASSWGQEG